MITNEEIDWLRKGSKDEDDRQGLLIRSNNHFYNPSGLKKWIVNDTLIGNSVPEPKLTAKEWAHDSLEQDSFPGGDYTWERAIWDYAQGDQQHAYESLGHILHLIEDSAVPAHTRNDLHLTPGDQDLAPFQKLPNFEAIKKALQGDGEPYEEWTGAKANSHGLDFNFADKLNNENKKPIILGSIDEYFDEMAKYTNTNFFSKDTIYAFAEPNNHIIEGFEKTLDGKIEDYVYGFDEINNKTRLAKISNDKSTNQKIYTLIELGDGVENNIFSDYWLHLAPRAVLTGAGAIKLFKDEAKKAAANAQAVNRPKTIASVYGRLAPAVRTVDPAIRTLSTIGQVAGNAALFSFQRAAIAAQNIFISFLNDTRSIMADSYAYFSNKTQEAIDAAYQFSSDKLAAFTGSLTSKTNLALTSAKAKILDIFTASAKEKAQLVFDMSKPIKATTIADIYQGDKVIITDADRSEAPSDHGYNGELIMESSGNIVSVPGQDLNLTLKIKNTGTQTWYNDRLFLGFSGDIDRKAWAHPSWVDDATPSRLLEPVLRPGEIGTFLFTFKIPSMPGDYVFYVRPMRGLIGSTEWLGIDMARWNIKVQKEEIQIPAIADNLVPEIFPTPSPAPSPIITPTPTLAPTPAIAPTSTPFIFYGGGGNYTSTPTPTPEISPTPSLSPSISPSPHPSPEATEGKPEVLPSASPTPEPSVSPSPSIEPSVSPSPAPIISPLPTPESSVSPSPDSTSSPQATPEISPSPLPSPSPIPSPTPLAPSEVERRIPAMADYPVISEILFDALGADAGKEFIEIYNPVASKDLKNWSLKYKYIKEDLTEEIVSLAAFGSKSEDITWVAKKGFLLIGFGGYEAANYGNVFSDIRRSAALPNGGSGQITIILSDKDDKEIDTFSYSSESITDTERSLERQANEFSTSISMSFGGIDERLGNGWDSDDSSADFVLQSVINPQNSASWAEPRPPKISNFTATSLSEESETINLSWTAPSSDSSGLTYMVKRAENEIITQADFDGASSVYGAPVFASGVTVSMEAVKDFSPIAYSSRARSSLFYNPFILAMMIAPIIPQNYYCFAVQIKDAEEIKSEIVGGCYALPEPDDGG